jgi:hypothetical protein
VTIVYFPVYKLALNYTVSFGRRWTVFEHLLLARLTADRLSVVELAETANVPERLVVEALINLLRQGWVEVRTTDQGTYFGTTPVGTRRAVEEHLPVHLHQRPRWISLCVDRLSGAWLRADDLQLVHERDLPEGARPLEPRVGTYDPDDGTLRELVYLDRDESFERFEPNYRMPSRLLARVEVAFGDVEGIPSYAPLRLRSMIIEAATTADATTRGYYTVATTPQNLEACVDTIGENDLIVGGEDHFSLLARCLQEARTIAVIHSCFVHPKAVERLLPYLEAAAARKVRIDLLWGLRVDPEDPTGLRPISETDRVLDRLSPTARSRVQLSPISSGSHAKIVLLDTKNGWEAVIGSCNYLSSFYDLLDVSVRIRSLRMVAQLFARLIAAQVPASGAWSPVARRLDRVWNEIMRASNGQREVGSHRLTLLADEDHYACITLARDHSQQDIVVGCDLFGLAAETSVMVPMTRAAEMGRDVRLLYRRPSRGFLSDGRMPDQENVKQRGMSLEQIPDLHGKFLAWDDNAVAITSFNWMSASVENTRAKGAELGVLVVGSGLRDLLTAKFARATNGKVEMSVTQSGQFALGL